MSDNEIQNISLYFFCNLQANFNKISPFTDHIIHIPLPLVKLKKNGKGEYVDAYLNLSHSLRNKTSWKMEIFLLVYN